MRFAGSLPQVSTRKVLLILHIQRDLHDVFRQRAINMRRNAKSMEQWTRGVMARVVTRKCGWVVGRLLVEGEGSFKDFVQILLGHQS